MVPPQHPLAQGGHTTVPPQPSGIVPHPVQAAVVSGVHPQMPAVPPPPQVLGDVQLVFDVQPHPPLTHAVPVVEPVQLVHVPPA
jgi:hypothetical protein